MASNLDIDQDLLKEAQEVGSMKTKKATVNQALKEFIDRRKQEEIFEKQKNTRRMTEMEETPFTIIFTNFL